MQTTFRDIKSALAKYTALSLDPEAPDQLRGRAKVLSSRLGPARDLDVFLEELLIGPAKSFSGEDESEMFALLRAEAETMRDRAWEQASACVAGPDFAVFIDDVAALAQSRLPLAPGHKLKSLAARMLVRQAARLDDGVPESTALRLGALLAEAQSLYRQVLAADARSRGRDALLARALDPVLHLVAGGGVGE